MQGFSPSSRSSSVRISLVFQVDHFLSLSGRSSSVCISLCRSIILSEGAHHADLMFSTSLDPPDFTAARQSLLFLSFFLSLSLSLSLWTLLFLFVGVMVLRLFSLCSSSVVFFLSVFLLPLFFLSVCGCLSRKTRQVELNPYFPLEHTPQSPFYV